jgi:hypothetical protein
MRDHTDGDGEIKEDEQIAEPEAGADAGRVDDGVAPTPRDPSPSPRMASPRSFRPPPLGSASSTCCDLPIAAEFSWATIHACAVPPSALCAARKIRHAGVTARGLSSLAARGGALDIFQNRNRECRSATRRSRLTGPDRRRRATSANLDSGASVGRSRLLRCQGASQSAKHLGNFSRRRDVGMRSRASRKQVSVSTGSQVRTGGVRFANCSTAQGWRASPAQKYATSRPVSTTAPVLTGQTPPCIWDLSRSPRGRRLRHHSNLASNREVTAVPSAFRPCWARPRRADGARPPRPSLSLCVRAARPRL